MRCNDLPGCSSEQSLSPCAQIVATSLNSSVAFTELINYATPTMAPALLNITSL
jgi:hypothetical protein